MDERLNVGKWKYIYSDNSYYEGTWIRNQRQGFGHMKWVGGAKYRGS
jgi:hypothetical protein